MVDSHDGLDEGAPPGPVTSSEKPIRRIHVDMEDVTPSKSSPSWTNIERGIKVASAIMIPLVGVWVGWLIQESSTKTEYLKQAVGELTRHGSSLEMRSWAADVFAKYSPVPVSAKLEESLRTGTVRLSEGLFKYQVTFYSDGLKDDVEVEFEGDFTPRFIQEFKGPIKAGVDRRTFTTDEAIGNVLTAEVRKLSRSDTKSWTIDRMTIQEGRSLWALNYRAEDDKAIHQLPQSGTMAPEVNTIKLTSLTFAPK